VAAWAELLAAAVAAASGSTPTTPEGAKRLASGLVGRPAAGSIDVKYRPDLGMVLGQPLGQAPDRIPVGLDGVGDRLAEVVGTSLG
jgi:hypothetical protein